MKFVHPQFLWALTLIAIPVIVHLFHFRRYKRIDFTNVAFLKELQKETRSYQKLRNILVLVARIFFVAFLVLAFAQPYIPGRANLNPETEEQVFLFLDNSFSMEATAPEGPLLELAKNKARGIVKSYRNSQKFYLLTNANPDAGIPMNKDDVLSAIDDIEVFPFQISRKELVDRVLFRNSQSPADRSSLYWISDFQDNKEPATATSESDSSMHIYFLPLRPQQVANLSVDSVWLETPVIEKDKPVNIRVRIRNYGQTDAEGASLNLVADGTNMSVLGFDCKAGSSIDLDLSYIPNSGGWKELEFALSDRDIYFDDRYFITLHVKPGVDILEIKGRDAGNYFSNLFGTDPYFKHETAAEGNIRVSSFEKLDFIILNELSETSSGLTENLSEFCRNGGSILIIPNRKNPAGLNSFCKSLGLGEYGAKENNELRVTKMYVEDPLLQEVFEKVPSNPDYPSVRSYFRISSTALPLLDISGNQVFLQYQNIGQGKAFQLAVALDAEFSNFQQHALFVPFVLKMAFNRGSDFAPSYLIDARQTIARGIPGLPQLQSKLEVEGAGQRWIPVVQAQGGQSLLDLGDGVREAGFYRIRSEDSVLQSIALNFNRDESVDHFLDAEELPNIAPSIASDIWNDDAVPVSLRIEESQLGERFWKTCILLSLIFMAIEILLLRLWRQRPKETVLQPEATN